MVITGRSGQRFYKNGVSRKPQDGMESVSRRWRNFLKMTHAPVFDARDPRASMEGGGRGRGKPIGKRSTRALRIDPLPDMNLVLCSRNQRHVEAINFFGKPTNRHRILLFSSPSSSFKLCTRVFVVFFSLEKKRNFWAIFLKKNREIVIIMMVLEKLWFNEN